MIRVGLIVEQCNFFAKFEKKFPCCKVIFQQGTMEFANIGSGGVFICAIIRICGENSE